ncbi:MAG: hypothetical protein NZ942_03235 [Candidatus Aenigmarchaeota archaeon]|nr:hypothetical protein [Candidatus Aenigmarchaeota archaeon]
MEGKIKLKISKSRLILIFIICALLIISFNTFKNQELKKPITSWYYDGYLLEFRSDLREAQKVKVYPSEEAVYQQLFNPKVKNITIAFKSAGERENPYYIIEEMEIIQKLYVAYKKRNIKLNFNGLEVENYERLYGKEENPIIALVHPVFSNETLIELKNHVIFLKAKNYHDFDLVAIKLIMIGLNITVE